MYFIQKNVQTGGGAMERTELCSTCCRLALYTSSVVRLTGRLELSEGILNAEMVVDVLACRLVCLWFVLNGADSRKM